MNKQYKIIVLMLFTSVGLISAISFTNHTDYPAKVFIRTPSANFFCYDHNIELTVDAGETKEASLKACIPTTVVALVKEDTDEDFPDENTKDPQQLRKVTSDGRSSGFTGGTNFRLEFITGPDRKKDYKLYW